MIAAVTGLAPQDMGGWAWFLMTLMTVFWLVVAVAAVLIAVAATRDRERGTGA